MWADLAYSDEGFEGLINLGSCENPTHDKGSRNNPLCDAVKESNRVQSSTWDCVEHIFCYITMWMGG